MRIFAVQAMTRTLSTETRATVPPNHTAVPRPGAPHTDTAPRPSTAMIPDFSSPASGTGRVSAPCGPMLAAGTPMRTRSTETSPTVPLQPVVHPSPRPRATVKKSARTKTDGRIVRREQQLLVGWHRAQVVRRHRLLYLYRTSRAPFLESSTQAVIAAAIASCWIDAVEPRLKNDGLPRYIDDSRDLPRRATATSAEPALDLSGNDPACDGAVRRSEGRRECAST